MAPQLWIIGVLLSSLNSFVAIEGSFASPCNCTSQLEYVKLSVDPNLVDSNGIVLDRPISCSDYEGVLSWQQLGVCYQRDPRYLSCFALGLRQAVYWCGRVFNQSKWNCSHAVRQLVFGKFVHTMNLKERATVMAMISSSVLTELTTCCREGLLRDCACYYPPDIRHQILMVNGTVTIFYPGCSDRIDIPAERTRSLLDVLPPHHDDEPCEIADRHNIEAGIEMASVTTKHCHCHGVTASCSLKTCKHRMQHYSNVANQMLYKHSGAVKVQDGSQSDRMIPENTRADPPGSKDLVYFCDSPDYSIADPSLDIPGTENRICNPTRQGLGSCDLFCGGRGYYKRTSTYPEYETFFDFSTFTIGKRLIGYETVTEHFCN